VPAISVARARDPWVFRCVLDHKPRMVVLALSDDMWVAYDAATCALYKAWKGGVNFDGPVYTTVHGPQPTTVGRAYTEGITDAWSANVAGQDVPVRATWRGYALQGDHAILRYELELPDGRKVSVRESPEFVRPELLFPEDRREELVLADGHPGLWRSFAAEGIPPDTKVTLQVRTDAESKLAETLERERFVDVPDGSGGTRTQVISRLVLTQQRPTSNLVLFFAPFPPEPPSTPAGAAGKEK
jgi:hypothetical protein